MSDRIVTSGEAERYLKLVQIQIISALAVPVCLVASVRIPSARPIYLSLLLIFLLAFHAARVIAYRGLFSRTEAGDRSERVRLPRSSVYIAEAASVVGRNSRRVMQKMWLNAALVTGGALALGAVIGLL